MNILVNIYKKIILTYNLNAIRNIPYRSEALADYLQATILDDIHTLMMDVDMAYQK